MYTPADAAAKLERDKVRILKLSATDFQQKAVLQDDDLDTIATIDTSKGFRSLGGLADLQRGDVFLRAHIDKRSGDTSYQVYQSIWYKQTEQRDYQIVNYQDGDQIRSASLSAISSSILDCGQYSSALGCDREESVAFDIPSDLLKRVAAEPADRFWRFKFRAHTGNDWEDVISPAEAAGLIAAVNAYKNTHHLP